MIFINNKIEIAIIPVAGRGTRFFPITKSVSKTMLPICNKPTLQYILEEVIDANIKEIILVINQKQNDIIKYLDPNTMEEEKTYKLDEINNLINKLNIHYVIQPLPHGIGDAIIRCKEIIGNRDFSVLLGDDVIDKGCDNIYGIGSLIEKYMLDKANYIGVQYVEDDDRYKYGIVDIDNEYNLMNIVEKPIFSPPSNYAIVGRYIFENNILNYLSSLNLDNESEIKITDALNKMIESEKILVTTFNGIRYDMGDMYEFVIANIEFLMKDSKLSKKLLKYMKKKLHSDM